MQSEQSSEEVKKLLDYLGQRLFHIENFYLIYSELGLHYNKAVNPDSSKAYLEIINSHKGFFMPIQEALRATLTVELNTFIVSKDFKSLRRAIELLKDIESGVDLTAEYENLKEKNGNVLKHIEEFRKKYYAHKTSADLSKLRSASDKEYQELFEAIKELLNKAHGHFGKANWYMEGDSRESIKDTHDLMNCLLRGESQRLSEINVEYISSIYESGKRNWMKT